MPSFLVGSRKEKQPKLIRRDGPRIPVSLQAVFLASNRGTSVDIIKAPPSHKAPSKPPAVTAPKRQWFLQSRSSKPSPCPEDSGSTSKQTTRNTKHLQYIHQNKTNELTNNAINSNHSFSSTNKSKRSVEPSRRHVQRNPSNDSMEKGQSKDCEYYSMKPKKSSLQQHQPTTLFMDFPGARSSSCNDEHGMSGGEKPVVRKLFPTMTPQKYLEVMLVSRRYSIECYDVLQSAYYNKPTASQEASYGVFSVEAVRRNDSDMLDALFTLGLHPNACNAFGESLLHLACRCGNYNALCAMIDHQCNIQVSDDYGRTPLHDLCWAAEPCFKSALLLLQLDSRLLFMRDLRGSTPLAYTRKEHWSMWIKFIDNNKDVIWPKRYTGKSLSTQQGEGVPKLTKYRPNTRQLPDPSTYCYRTAISVQLASLLASGKISLQEAEMIRDEENNSYVGTDDDDDNDTWCSSDSGSLTLERSGTSCFVGDEELDDIIQTLNAMKTKSKANATAAIRRN